VSRALHFQTYSLGLRVKPMGDICAGGEDYRVALALSVVLVEQLREVVNFVEQ
jgi:DNA repair ATPase RecN